MTTDLSSRSQNAPPPIRRLRRFAVTSAVAIALAAIPIMAQAADTLITDFHAGFPVGQGVVPLAGTTTQIGDKVWDASAGVGRSGTTAINIGGDLDLMATVSLDPAQYPGYTSFAIEARVDAAATNWVNVGFMSQPASPTWSQPHISIQLKGTGRVVIKVRDDALTNHTLYASPTPHPAYLGGGLDRLKLEYDRTGNSLRAWINDSELAIANPGLNAIGFTPSLAYAGFHANSTDGFPAPGIFTLNDLTVSGSGGPVTPTPTRTPTPTHTPTPTPTPPSCIDGGTDADIQAALQGPYAEAVLCRGARFLLSHKVQFTADYQKIFTEGKPKEDNLKATLIIADSELTVAVQGFPDQPGVVGFHGVKLSHVIVDGHSDELPTVCSNEAPCTQGNRLIAMGKANDQVVSNVLARNPRCKVAIGVEQGAHGCLRASVTDNVVRDCCGSHEPHLWITGIAFACTGTVSGNRVVDFTDVGIALFAQGGSVIMENNFVRSNSKELLAAYALVDTMYADGDYSDTVVSKNVANGVAPGRIEIGFAMGPHVWFCQEGAGYPGPWEAHGAEVKNNHVLNEVAYGYLVSGVRDWKVSDNTCTGHRFQFPSSCGGIQNSESACFLWDEVGTNVTLQSEFGYPNPDNRSRLRRVHPTVLPTTCQDE